MVNGKKISVITAAFWGDGEEMVTPFLDEEIFLNSISIIEKQILPIEECILRWKEYYEMEEEEIELLKIIYDKIKKKSGEKIFLTKDEIKMLGEIDEDGIIEIKTSFSEMNIYLEK